MTFFTWLDGPRHGKVDFSIQLFRKQQEIFNRKASSHIDHIKKPLAFHKVPAFSLFVITLVEVLHCLAKICVHIPGADLEDKY